MFKPLGRGGSSRIAANPHGVNGVAQFRQKPRLPVDRVKGRAHNGTSRKISARVCSLRYLLAIGGLLLGVAAMIAVWIFLPRADAPASAAAGAAQAQQAPESDAKPGAEAAPADNTLQADTEGEGNLRVCNETSNPVSIALGYRAERGWQSEGWWVASPKECKTVYSGDVDARRYYYIYAADDIGGGSWDGNVFMCTRDETFTIFGVEDCLARGYERTGFFEIDTHNRSSWMLQLTDNQVPGAEPVDGTDDSVPLEGDLEGTVDERPPG